MTIELGIILLLIIIVVVQQGFFMWQINKLVNKLMSKDFHSYNHTVAPPQTFNGGFTVQLPDEGPDRLQELNRSFNAPL